MLATRGLTTPYLRAWRLHAALKQNELADKAHVARATVQRGERGEPLSIDNVRALAQALGVTVEQLRFQAPEE